MSCGGKASFRSVVAKLGSFVCAECKQATERTNLRQLYCRRPACKLAVKRKRLAKDRAKKRAVKNPLCQLCERSLPVGKRRYHESCFRQKERERASIHYVTKKKRRGTPVERVDHNVAQRNARDYWPAPLGGSNG